MPLRKGNIWEEMIKVFSRWLIDVIELIQTRFTLNDRGKPGQADFVLAILGVGVQQFFKRKECKRINGDGDILYNNFWEKAHFNH